MSPRSRHRLLRASVQAAFWLLLAVVSFGPQHSLIVCTSGLCGVLPQVADDEPPCCSHCSRKGTDAAGPRDPRVPAARAHGSRHCCVDVALLTELGPLPRSVDCPDLAMPCLGEARQAIAGGEPVAAARWWPPATGPPRPAARLLAIATTNLRI